MINECQPADALIQEIRQLRQELAEANRILYAIKHGEIDALLVSDSSQDQVFILKGADHIYRVLVEEMQEGCATVGADGVILFCNKNFADILKRPLERIIGSSIFEFLNPGDQEAFAEFLAEHKSSFKAECSLRTGAGFFAPVIIAASSICVEGDTFACLVATDLTEQRRSQRFLQLIFEQAKDPIIACDRNGQIVQANPAAVTLFRTQLVGESFEEVVSLSRSSDGTKIRLSQIIDSQSAYGVEAQYECQDSRVLTLLISAGSFAVEEDNLVGSVVMMRDITDKRLVADELARLDRLNIVGEMAAGIGHEVRNPLTTVRGYLQMFSLKTKYSEDQERFGIMIEELDRANSIITEFLSLAKNKAVNLIPGNLNGTIHALFPLLQADAFRLGHEVQADVGDIPVICYDDKEMRQLILNLVRNGLEAMETAGVITIRTYTECDNVILAVQDTGHGIPKEVLDKIGIPFVTTKEAGTGLGLSVCYRIADRHQAKIEVKTSPLGTTFYVKFKAYKREV